MAHGNSRAEGGAIMRGHCYQKVCLGSFTSQMPPFANMVEEGLTLGRGEAN